MKYEILGFQGDFNCKHFLFLIIVKIKQTKTSGLK